MSLPDGEIQILGIITPVMTVAPVIIFASIQLLQVASYKKISNFTVNRDHTYKK